MRWSVVKMRDKLRYKYIPENREEGRGICRGILTGGGEVYNDSKTVREGEGGHECNLLR